MVDVIDELAELLEELETRSGDSVGPGVESIAVELYAAIGTARFDTATFDGATWSLASWQSVGCEVLEADYQSGASQEAGVLSVPDAGALDLRTFDPDRLLDPLNTASPFYGSIRPGTPIRIRQLPDALPAWQGFIDEARFELASSTGRIRAVDAIAYLAQAEVPEGTALPTTLRARVRAVVAAVGLGTLIPVAPDDPGPPDLWGGLGAMTGAPFFTGFGNAATWIQGSSQGSADGDGMSGRFGGTATPNPFMQSGWIDLPGGALPLRVTGWLWATGAPPGLRVEMSQQPADWSGGIPSLGPFDLPAATYAAGWTPFTLDVTTAPTTAHFQIQLTMLAAANAAKWNVDGLALRDRGQIPADPPVAPHDGKARSAWAIIQDAALDALTFVWLDATGTIRFTAWGSLPDALFSVGCSDGLGGAWLEGLASLETIAQAESIRNAVRWWSATDTFAAPLKDGPSVARYGERRLDAPRVVPNASVWAQRILDDRADSGLEVTLGELRPYSSAELALLLSGALAGPSVVRVRDDSHGELVDLDVAVLGAAVGITPNGWRFRQVAMIPRAEWDATPPAPVDPPTPPAGTYHQETRSYVATSDALLALTSGGSKYGAGAATTLPVGAWQGWTYRSLVQLPAIPWTKVRRIVSATLILTTTTAVRIGFGSSPTIDLKRITGSWSAGSSSSPSSGNAVVWPGPAVTGSVRANVTKSQNATVRIRVDGLVLPWAPVGIGGIAAAQRGLALYPGSGSSADTTELWPVEKGGSSRPSLELVVEVFD